MIQTIFCTTPNLLQMTLISLVFSFLFHNTHSQIVTRFASLTPTNTYSTGASLIKSINEVTRPNDAAWRVDIRSQSTWQFIISLDQTWGFNPSKPSTISLTINSPSMLTTDLLFGFTTNNMHYISMAIPMDHSMRDVELFPACNSMAAGIGDIAALPDFNRMCDIAGGSCSNWNSASFNTNNLALTPPITFTLENDPSTNTMEIYLNSAKSASSTTARCKYAAFPTNSGLKIYIAGNNPSESFMVSSFDIIATIKNEGNGAPIVPPEIPSIPNPLPIVPPQTTQRAVVPQKPVVPVKTVTTMPPVPAPVPVIVPTTTLAPGQALGAFNQICAEPSANSQCQTATDIASGPSFTKCEREYDCCLCSAVQCGNTEVGCRRFSAGPAGVFSVKSIGILGAESGATIDCFGVESCALSKMDAKNVGVIKAGNDYALKNAVISVSDPVLGFRLECIGTGSCLGLELELVIPGPPVGYECNPEHPIEILEWETIRCSGVDSCKNMKLTVRNNGCNVVDIGALECDDPSACSGANFNFIGNVDIARCNINGLGAGIHGIDGCFENIENMLCPDPTSCANAVRSFKNPVNGFMMNCGDVGSCSGSSFVFNVDATVPEPVQYLDGFKFSAESAAAGSTLIFNNNQVDVFLEIERVECSAADACLDTMFILGDNVQIAEIACVAGACNGCEIRIDPNQPGIPCTAAEPI